MPPLWGIAGGLIRLFSKTASYIVEGGMEKQDARASLIEYVEAELAKEPSRIDGDFIDRQISELCALAPLARRTVRGLWAACGAFLLLFSVNYLAAMVTGSCLPSRAGVKFCCGTRYCACDTARGEKKTSSAQNENKKMQLFHSFPSQYIGLIK
jgi:hypothetical protein